MQVSKMTWVSKTSV